MLWLNLRMTRKDWNGVGVIRITFVKLMILTLNKKNKNNKTNQFSNNHLNDKQYFHNPKSSNNSPYRKYNTNLLYSKDNHPKYHNKYNSLNYNSSLDFNNSNLDFNSRSHNYRIIVCHNISNPTPCNIISSHKSIYQANSSKKNRIFLTFFRIKENCLSVRSVTMQGNRGLIGTQ